MVDTCSWKREWKMVHKVSINFKSSNICSNPQSFRVYHGGKEGSWQAKNPDSSQVHSLSSLALKYWRRRASFPAKTWGLWKQDVNLVCWNLEAQPPETSAAKCIYFTSGVPISPLSLPLSLFFLASHMDICIIQCRSFCPVTLIGCLLIESLSIKTKQSKNTLKPFSEQPCDFLSYISFSPKFRGIPDHFAIS